MVALGSAGRGRWWAGAAVLTALAAVAVSVPLVTRGGPELEVATVLERAEPAQADRAHRPASALERAPTEEVAGDDDAPSDPQGPPTDVETSPAPTDPPQAPCPNLVPDEDHEGPPGSTPEVEGAWRHQDRYMGDVQLAVAYGERHPDEFVGVRFLNSEPGVRLAVAFTGSPEVHCEALRGTLEHPDDFELWQMPWSARHLRQVQDEVVAALPDASMMRMSGIGFGGPVELHVRADAEAVARQLWERHGEVLDLRVGLHRYPAPRGAGRAPECDVDLAPPPSPATGVRATLEVDQPELGRGRDGTGTLTVRNDGLEPVTVSPSPRIATILARGTERVVGVLDQTAWPAIGYADRTLRLGESVTVPVVFGTASCEVTDGYALAPGTYDVVTAIDVRRGDRSTPVRSTTAALRVHA